MLVQDFEKCSPSERDCIEGNFTLKFNCRVNCEGIYADVQWVEEGIYGYKEENFAEEDRTIGKRGVEQDRKKYMRLISEYKHFKENVVQHFRFNDTLGYNFGRFLHFVKVRIFSGEKLSRSNLQLVQIYFDTATFDDIEKDKKIKTEAQLSLIGGTMGLLTGFSIISGIEIIFFLFRMVSSFRITRTEVVSAKKNKFQNHLM